jgi:hypothetical protein
VPTTTVRLDSTSFDQVRTNTVDNAAGHIDLAASRTISPSLSGTFTIGTIRFRSKSTVLSTTVTFAISETRQSDLLLAGDSLDPTLAGSTFTITSDMVLTGWIEPPQRGEEGDPRWRTDLFRRTPDGTVGGITIFETETENVIDTFATTTDAFGEFSVTLPGISPGIYDVQVKGATTLSMRHVGVHLPRENEIFFGMLPLGDSTGDDTIDAQDAAFIEERLLTTVEDDTYSHYADLTRDGVVDGADISALVPAFGASGPIMIMGALPQQARPPMSQTYLSDTSGLAMNADRVSARAGDVITVDIVASVDQSIADTVDAYLNFDPRLLEVVDTNDNPTESIELNTDLFDQAIVNTVDNASGQINLSASVFGEPYLEGDFIVATARFRARVAIDALALGFAQGGVRASNIYRFGESVNPRLTNIGEPPEPEPCIVCLPLVVR